MKAELNPKTLISVSTIGIAILFMMTYLLSVYQGQNPLCNPFISGCTDITHAGFSGYANYMLKATLIPTATLMAIIFFFIQAWLVQLSDNKPSIIKQGKIILTLAIIGCIGLTLGTAVIDGNNTPMQFHLKCVAIFFVGMSICQVWYTALEYKYTYKVNKLPVMMRRVAILITAAFAIWSIFMDQIPANNAIVEWWGVYALIFWFWTFSINKRID